MISTILENFKECEDKICIYRLPLETLKISKGINFVRIEWSGTHTNIFVDFDEKSKPLYFEFYSTKPRFGERKNSMYYPDEKFMDFFIKYITKFTDLYDGYSGDYEKNKVEDMKNSIRMHENPQEMWEILKIMTIPYDISQIEDYELKIYPPLWK